MASIQAGKAIGWATVNRVGERQYGMTLDAVLRKRNGFQILEVGGGPKGDSKLWKETADPSKLKGDKLKGWERALAVSKAIMIGTLADPTGGATYFISSTTYKRGQPNTTNGFVRSGLISGILIDSPYISQSGRVRQNHFYIEKPPQLPKSKKKG
jgi:hypothetical protein